MSKNNNDRLNELKQKVSEGKSLDPTEIKEIFLIMLHNEELLSDNK